MPKIPLIHIRVGLHLSAYMCVYVYLCVYVCVCVCEEFDRKTWQAPF